MQIKQIIVHPDSKGPVVIQYSDLAGRSGSMIYAEASAQTIAQLAEQCREQLPPPAERPDKEEIETEIRHLERRLEELNESIGNT